jgi:hypothetical protein
MVREYFEKLKNKSFNTDFVMGEKRQYESFGYM